MNIHCVQKFKMSAQQKNNEKGTKRKQNFTAAECSLLVDLVEKNMDTLRGQFSCTITNDKKQKLWETMASQINSLGHEKRTPKEIRGKLRNMAQIAKKKTILGYSSLKEKLVESCSKTTNHYHGENCQSFE